MFTGIIEEIGTVKGVKRGNRSVVLEVQAKKVLEDLKVGDSIATNGVCLTVTSFTGSVFCADVMPETMQRSNLGELRAGDRVNLERALTLNGRLGGHIVSGHIDGTGKIVGREKDENAIWISVATSGELLRYIVDKGSITIDGISLTVVSVNDAGFTVSIIPHTQDETTLVKKKIGDTVNLENDVIAKYVEKLMRPAEPSEPKGGMTLDFLLANGF
ncbi:MULTISPECIES: riboflavin synthase [Odoribacteraceae]|uniref:riboflavin synthase n=1 Tax=Odoribacteraceae TaxID=1853231 RepID=UPI000E477C6B|nr:MULTISPECIES: riboflavin synthase [Odoribacteraceae]MCQ4873697.1 riboflavin synthase [Butyricimonas paravirosa]RHR75744.1 riboflavin synthase [Odoribacter sp. AF15-53]